MATILVPVDFSDCSFDVVRYAARLARALEARLLLLHVLELPPKLTRDSEIQPDPDTPPMTAWEFVKGAATEHMPLYTSLCGLDGLGVTTQIVNGQPTEVIVAASEAPEIEQIVMGTHGRRGFARMMTGSVAESVLRRAERPVTLIRSQHKDSCDARSCAWCSSGTLDALRRLWTEFDG